MFPFLSVYCSRVFRSFALCCFVLLVLPCFVCLFVVDRFCFLLLSCCLVRCFASI